MSKTAHLRLLADYLAATRNEIAVDEMFLGLARVTAAKVGYLPRIPHWITWAVRAPALTRSIWYLGRLLWLSGGAMIFFAFELLKFNIFRSRQGNASTKTIPLTKGAVLGSSSRVCDVVDPDHFPWLPAVWMTCPWAVQHTLPKSALELPLLSLLTTSDLVDAFNFAIRATYTQARDPKHSRWVLQCYTAMRWHMVRSAVDKIAGTLVTTDHFDRWAVLLDRSIRADRRKGAAARRLVLVQHGALGGLRGPDQGSESIKPLPVRLAYVEELHTYNAKEEAAFRGAVLSRMRQRLPLRVHYFSPAITLIGENLSGRPRLLFVGHPLCEEFQVRVYKALGASLAFDALYKPHPRAPMSAAMAKVGWTIFEDSRSFPKVELLVSYPSTLVIEYEGAGIPAVVHPLDVGSDALPEFLDQIVQKIKKSTPTYEYVKQEPIGHA